MVHSEIQIIPYAPHHATDFKRLNLEWLKTYFTVEPIDEEVLSHPDKLIEHGGAVLMARIGDEIVGTCALLHEGHGRYELTKTAVTPTHQGKGIGRLLVQAAIAEFGTLNGRELYLESSSVLKTAVTLYEKLGFQHTPRPTPSVYNRANVYMVYGGGDRKL